MSQVVQHRRGTAAQHVGFTGAPGEFTFTTDTHRIVTHDGVTAGGFPHALVAEVILKANNLSDLANVALARTNLGLGGAAVLNVGTAAGTVAAGDDARFAAAALKANNLSDLANAATARTNLGLGALATKSTIASADITDGSIATADLANAAVTNAKLADMLNATIKGRVTGGTGAPEDLSVAQVKSLLDLVLVATSHFGVPSGNTAARPGAPLAGYLRYNSETVGFEGYRNGAWKSVGGGPAVGTDSVIRMNLNTIDEDITIPANNNGFSGGPMTVSNGRTVTIAAAAVWTVI